MFIKPVTVRDSSALFGKPPSLTQLHKNNSGPPMHVGGRETCNRLDHGVGPRDDIHGWDLTATPITLAAHHSDNGINLLAPT